MTAVLEDRIEAAPASLALNLVDAEHPWLGLDSFSEETRQFFHGREEEIAELARRVQGKLLTILFGQSGLGKTSILRAGIVPRLRREGFCPVYVRVDYSSGSPSPSEQIKQAILRETEALGEWSQPGSAVKGESLWEFLHHRDDVLRDASGKALTPLLIFDQFEEIFTIGQGDDFGRKRAGEFIEDLADLVENRAPATLEQMLDSDDTVVDRFDFSRADYRVLISLREDYLPNLESFRGSMPSVTQNRMRLARMTGQQALAAVTIPGGRLVTEEVAEAIVRFVAGGSEIRNAEVEPSLLSLICRELNNARVAQGRPEISADLLAGSRETILKEFYERALKDQPAGVRRFIEDEMLTESGFRESLAEERVQRAFAAAGAPAGSIASLVNRRLLRIEERLDLRRVELTHDVLCKVVVESRDERHEREEREEMERQLAAERASKAAAHKALVRARQIAGACAVLAIGAIGSAIWGFQSAQRAHEAEAHTERTRASAEKARAEAEKLVAYLLDDFYLELEPVGRLDVMGDLAKRALAYYAGLPAELRAGETERNRALALVRYGLVLRSQAKIEESVKAFDEAVPVLGRLREAGDTTEVAAIGHALGLSGKARVLLLRSRVDEAIAPSEQAVRILEPLAAGPASSVAARRAYGVVAMIRAFAVNSKEGDRAAIPAYEAAREAFRRVDGLALKDLSAAAGFVDVSSSLMESLANLGQSDQARKIGGEGIEIAGRILANRPGHMGALRSRGLIAATLSRVEIWDLQLRKAIVLSESAAADWEALAALDPGNALAWGNLVGTQVWMARGSNDLGRTNQGVSILRSAMDVERRAGAAKSTFLSSRLTWAEGQRSIWEADRGDFVRANALLASMRAHAEPVLAAMQKDSVTRAAYSAFLANTAARSALAAADFPAAREILQGSIAALGQTKSKSEREETSRNFELASANQLLGLVLHEQRDYAGAEGALREAVKHRNLLNWYTLEDLIDKHGDAVLLAMVLARQGRLAQARETIEPVLAFHRSLPPRAAESVKRQFQWAAALYSAALASPAQGASLLAEATRVLDALPPETAAKRSVGSVRGWIARTKAGAS